MRVALLRELHERFAGVVGATPQSASNGRPIAGAQSSVVEPIRERLASIQSSEIRVLEFGSAERPEACDVSAVE
jgi:hypothetical protein